MTKADLLMPATIRRISLAAGFIAVLIKILHPGIVLAILVFSGIILIPLLGPWIAARLVTWRDSVWLKAGKGGLRRRDAAIPYIYSGLALLFCATIADGSLAEGSASTSLLIRILGWFGVGWRSAEDVSNSIAFFAAVLAVGLTCYVMGRFIGLKLHYRQKNAPPKG